MISPTTVSNNFLRKAKAESVEVTPLKLQKLVYFLYREVLQQTSAKLFTEQFETWTFGPVLPSIYNEFNSYGNEPIKTYALNSKGEAICVREVGVFGEIIDNVWKRYKNYSGIELSNMTHKPGTAWSKAKENESQFLDDEDIKNEQEA